MGDDGDEIARKRLVRDFRDLQAELSGTNAGRMLRFLTPAEAARRPGSKEKTERDEAFWAWVHSAEYAARTQALSKNLSNALTATDKALAENAKKIREAEERLEDVRRRAQRLDDGSLVYRASNGSVYTDDGHEVPIGDARRIQWRPGVPTWEARQTLGDSYSHVLKEQKELTRFRKKVVKHQERLKSDEPLSPDELAGMEFDVKDVPAAVRPHMRENRTASASRAYTDGAVEGPSVSAAFQNAAEGITRDRQTVRPEPDILRGPAPT